MFHKVKEVVPLQDMRLCVRFALHKDELIEMWETQEFKKLDSLE